MQATFTKTDSRIQQDVLEELKWDPRVEETDVGVEVDNGIVTLTGTVTSLAKRIAAQEAAHRVKGVLDVANTIVVRPPGSPGRTDTELAQAVRTALQWNVMVPKDRIKTTVSQGRVTLEGAVDNWYERDEAEKAIQPLSGLRSIVNNIHVTRIPVAPAKVQQAIEGALERRAERTANRITVSVEEGKVRLSGKVHSWQEREAVVGAAKVTSGVTEVDDRLTIAPDA
ncbi:MAG: BON domain-containing protein [Chloroflexi bacterium]|nr:BON domain-containing protein [Chloroflexota bacterium]